jgi:hypothetical protein
MPFWSVARLQPQRETARPQVSRPLWLRNHLPRVRQTRTTSQVVGLVGTVRRRKVEVEVPLFPGYCFILINCNGTG